MIADDYTEMGLILLAMDEAEGQVDHWPRPDDRDEVSDDVRTRRARSGRAERRRPVLML